ncbi:Transient receptor potential cation channel famil y protein M member 2 [Trichuris trichiura]|uniref:Transient receptor potential cation channel famil y protein M member 2 n=1 Tax=Trichuris trichiura TaxID=36087 RepID=A0A077ZHQ1_TRITR|nr:Transient receptor potential cation channel famil y protein M member 2 [Trichuris trichiura]
MRAWEVDYSNYIATLWKTPCYWGECDQGFSDYNFKPNFNQIDGNVDRRRAKTNCGVPTYTISGGLPLNPEGRTGYRGRGILPRWGPNHLGFVDDARNGYPKSIKAKFDKILRRANITASERKELLQKSEKTLIEVISGSMPYSWNTDNAWVEYHYYALPCNMNKLLCTLLMKLTNEKKEWILELSLDSWKRMVGQMKVATKHSLFPGQYSAFCQKKSPVTRFFTGSKN